MKILNLTACVALLAAAGFSTVKGDEPITAQPSSEFKWEKTPEGVAFAPLVGDRFAGSYMAMVRLPGGLQSPPHTKSADMFGVMVSGAMTHVPAGQDANSGKRLAAGAFYRIPAGVPHVSSCVSEQDCITFLYQDGKFDFLPVTE